MLVIYHPVEAEEYVYGGVVVIGPNSSYEYVQNNLEKNSTIDIMWNVRLSFHKIDFIVTDEMDNVILKATDVSEFVGQIQIDEPGNYYFIWKNIGNKNCTINYDIYIDTSLDIPYKTEVGIQCSQWYRGWEQGATVSLIYNISANSVSDKDIVLHSFEVHYDFLPEAHRWSFLPEGLEIAPDPDVLSFSNTTIISIDEATEPGFHWMNGSIVYEVDRIIVHLYFFSMNSYYIVERDSDGDGFVDSRDKFPEDPSEWNDTDGDGFGDNSDAFPDNSSEWSDTDGDGVGDNGDVFPQNPNEWKDTDKDGWGDNIDDFPDDPSEWKDTDGDGVGDNIDQLPLDPDEWVDSDGDGHYDNSDEFQLDPKEWKDTDRDGTGDRGDKFPTDPAASVDTDGDGYPDAWNPGKNETDSTTGLKLDGYPDDPDKWKEEEKDSISLYLIVAIIIALLLILALGTTSYAMIAKHGKGQSEKGRISSDDVGNS
ncbi:MAG: hypothetical protein ACMUIE_03780 [Thermoplasmatota archaeon]